MYLIWSTSLLATIAAAVPYVVNTVKDVSYQGTTSDGVEQFQNIYFAEDTTGANRFEPPKPYFPPPGAVVDAKSPGVGCPQAKKGAIPAMSDVPNQSENCLTLRIARPAGYTGKPLPVMVYIYGGGSILGEAYDDFFIPTGLIQQSVLNGEPVIYAAMNYRIGVFGFAASETLKQKKAENIGLRDQYLALEWIRDNIAHFGGDPSQVTLFGQSFGGISIGLHLTSYGGEGTPLFNKAIMASGSVSGDRSDAFTVKSTGLVADKLGCSSKPGLVDDAAVECLKKIPTDEITKVQLDVATEVKGGFGFAAYPPVVDGDFIPEQPDYLLAKGKFHKNVPLLVTWVRDDGSFSASADIDSDQGVIDSFKSAFYDFDDNLAKKVLELYPLSEFEDQAASTEPKVSPQFYRASRIQRDIDPACPLIHIARTLYKAGVEDVYIGELNETRLGPYWKAWNSPLGNSHLSDVPYFFNEPIPEPGDNSPEAKALSANYSGSFSTFAVTGNPVGPGKTTFQKWPKAFSPGSDEFEALVIGGPFGTSPAYSAAASHSVGGKSESEIESDDQGSSRISISIEQGRQVVLDAVVRSGSFASAAYEHVTGGRRKSPPRRAPQKVKAASAFADEKLLERCKFVFEHRI